MCMSEQTNVHVERDPTYRQGNREMNLKPCHGSNKKNNNSSFLVSLEECCLHQLDGGRMYTCACLCL